MAESMIKKVIADIRPCAEKIVYDAARGYVFGCLFGAFVQSPKSLGSAMHDNGKNFAKMAAAYSATEIAVAKIRGKSDGYNTIVAGAVAGGVGSRQGMAAGACVLGAYSGLAQYFMK